MSCCREVSHELSDLDEEPKMLQVDQVRAFYEAIFDDGYEADRSIRVNFIGNFSQDETSLSRRLIERSPEETRSTNGWWRYMSNYSQAREDGYETDRSSRVNNDEYFRLGRWRYMSNYSQAREDGYETDRSSRVNNDEYFRLGWWRYMSNYSQAREDGYETDRSSRVNNDEYFRLDNAVQNLRVLRNSIPVLKTELGTDSLVRFFRKCGIVTYGEKKLQGWRSNKMFEYVKDMDSGSYDAFISCLVESGNEHLVLYLEEQEAKLERMIMSETEKRQKSVKEKESVSNRWQEVLTEVFRRTVGSESNLYIWKQESEINSYLLKHLQNVFWNEDLNTSFLSDNNGKDLGEFTLQSDEEIGVSMHTDNVTVKVELIADDSYEMQAGEGFRELEQMLMCKVCLNADLDILFLPCRHMATCESCASELLSCPVCRSTIQDSVKLNYE